MRRWYRRILICLILGAVTTVGVAWGCALGERLIPVPDQPLSQRAIDRWSQIRQESWPEQPEAFNTGNRFGMTSWWTTTVGKSFGIVQMGELSFGLPVRCLYFEWGDSSDDSGPNGSRGVFPTPSPWLPGGPDYIVGVAFPTIPIWRGIVVNTLFYGAIWLGLFLGFGAARRGLRRKRGLCPMCAYDLRGGAIGPAGSRASPLGCPECGWNRQTPETEPLKGKDTAT